MLETTEAGPCLPHCYKCTPGVMVLAHMSFVYVVACVVYIVSTACMGTPFADSLTADQKKIKERAAHKRGTIFTAGLLIGFAMVHFMRPFRKSAMKI